MNSSRRCGLILAALWGTISPPAALYAQPHEVECKRLCVLIAVDTDDQGGITWRRDGLNMKALIEAAVKKQQLTDRTTIDVMTGKQVTPENILDYYRKLKVEKDDALFFYYSGHGGFHLNKGHFLALTHGQLLRNDLIAAMDTAHPRLRVLMTDCCANIAGGVIPGEPRIVAEMGRQQQPGGGHPPSKNEEPQVFRVVSRFNPKRVLPSPRPTIQVPTSFPKAKTEEPPSESAEIDNPKPRDMPKAKREEPPVALERGFKPGESLPILTTHQGQVAMSEVLDAADGEILRHLLFRHKGLVDINGSTKGEASFGTIGWGGSLFTNSLIVLQKMRAADFDANRNRVVEWTEFFPSLRKSTDDVASRLPRQVIHQVPEAIKLADPVLP